MYDNHDDLCEQLDVATRLENVLEVYEYHEDPANEEEPDGPSVHRQVSRVSQSCKGDVHEARERSDESEWSEEADPMQDSHVQERFLENSSFLGQGFARMWGKELEEKLLTAT